MPSTTAEDCGNVVMGRHVPEMGSAPGDMETWNTAGCKLLPRLGASRPCHRHSRSCSMRSFAMATCCLTGTTVRCSGAVACSRVLDDDTILPSGEVERSDSSWVGCTDTAGASLGAQARPGTFCSHAGCLPELSAATVAATGTAINSAATPKSLYLCAADPRCLRAPGLFTIVRPGDRPKRTAPKHVRTGCTLFTRKLGQSSDRPPAGFRNTNSPDLHRSRSVNALAEQHKGLEYRELPGN